MPVTASSRPRSTADTEGSKAIADAITRPAAHDSTTARAAITRVD
jgi:hypothetical protein